MTDIQNYSPSIDLLRSILWAYNKAENLQGLIQLKQDWYQTNHIDFFDDWVRDVFDLRTANSFGLSVWAIILDLPLFGDGEVSPPDFPAFGFDTGEGFPATSPIRAFENDTPPITTGGSFATDAKGVFGVPLEQKRFLLRLKYYQLSSRPSIPRINEFLQYLYGQNQIYALDGLDMTMTYVLVGASAVEMLSLFQFFDVLPRPAGVKVEFVTEGIESFGFDPVGLNFNNGSFVP